MYKRVCTMCQARCRGVPVTASMSGRSWARYRGHQVNQTQARCPRSSQSGGGGQEKSRLEKSSPMCSKHSPWETTEEVSQGGPGAGTARRTPAGGRPRRPSEPYRNAPAAGGGGHRAREGAQFCHLPAVGLQRLLHLSVPHL